MYCTQGGSPKLRDNKMSNSRNNQSPPKGSVDQTNYQSNENYWNKSSSKGNLGRMGGRMANTKLELIVWQLQKKGIATN